MKNAVETIKSNNPDFTYNLYDDNDCREFIMQNFDKPILDAYDKLIPGAYKADLWRYCVLYKTGGIYLDIKFIPVIKLNQLIDKEYFVKDMDNFGVYNGFMICTPNNGKLMRCINQIVMNTGTKFYGPNSLCPTGPQLLNKYFTVTEMKNMSCYLTVIRNEVLIFNDKVVLLKVYPNYRVEQYQFQKNKHYGDLWLTKKIYA